MFRIPPQGPPQAYKTYSVVSPVATHFRDASCEEVGCVNAVHGWVTDVDESTQLGQQQAYYIRRESGRRFVEEHPDSGLTRFVFAPDQECFAQHKTRVDRPERFLVRPGDWRVSARPYEHTRPELWLEDFAENQQTLADRVREG